jgi:hypothetical protein
MRHKDGKTTHKYYEFYVTSSEYAKAQLEKADIFKGKIIPMYNQPNQNICSQKQKNA